MAHVGKWDILGPYSKYMGTPLGPKYIPYTYMDPLGLNPGRHAYSVWHTLVDSEAVSA